MSNDAALLSLRLAQGLSAASSSLSSFQQQSCVHGALVQINRALILFIAGKWFLGGAPSLSSLEALSESLADAPVDGCGEVLSLVLDQQSWLSVLISVEPSLSLSYPKWQLEQNKAHSPALIASSTEINKPGIHWSKVSPLQLQSCISEAANFIQSQLELSGEY